MPLVDDIALPRLLECPDVDGIDSFYDPFKADKRRVGRLGMTGMP